MNKVYLDYNATAPMRPEIITLVTEVMNSVGNASSIHGFGRDARKYVETARDQVAALCDVDAEQVVFTGGATESINTVMSGFKDKSVLVSAIEHPAGLAAAPHAKKIPVTTDGVIDIEAYKKLLADEKPALVSIMLVNSETGVIQPILELAKLARAGGALFHCDAVQGAGRIDITMDKLGVDFISLSAHKMAGPQGVGAIITRNNVTLPRFIVGGGQEKNARAGTHNTAGIAGIGLAAKMALENLPHYVEITKMRDALETKIRALTNNIKIYGEKSPRVGNTINVGYADIPAQTQLMALDLDGVAVSSGSACSSGTFKASHVLTAMGASDIEAKSALRISLGWATTQADIDAFLASWAKLIERSSK